MMVTGAYYPEISAAAVQCRAAAASLRGRATVSVLTTAVTRGLRPDETVDGVPVFRVFVNVRSRISKALASIRLASRMFRERTGFEVIHLHGFSQKNVAVTMIGRLMRKPIVLTLHTSGQDEPAVARGRGVLAYWAFRTPDAVMSVSPGLEARWREAGLPADRLTLSPNGIDIERFRPADADERRALRRSLGWDETRPAVLFVGFFSRDKRPDLLFRAWRRLDAMERPQLVFVGAKGTGYFEVDEALAEAIRRDVAAMGCAGLVRFVEPTNDVDRCFRAADLFALPSIREAHPLALLEAMACGLPVIASRLSGSTDTIVENGVTGQLVAPDDEAALTAALRQTLADPGAARAMGLRARETVRARYDIRRTADAWLAAYESVLKR